MFLSLNTRFHRLSQALRIVYFNVRIMLVSGSRGIHLRYDQIEDEIRRSSGDRSSRCGAGSDSPYTQRWSSAGNPFRTLRAGRTSRAMRSRGPCRALRASRTYLSCGSHWALRAGRTLHSCSSCWTLRASRALCSHGS